jgi:hypothetical protein
MSVDFPTPAQATIETTVTSTFSLRFARTSESKIEAAVWLARRQTLQRIATGMSLLSEAIGYSILGD